MKKRCVTLGLIQPAIGESVAKNRERSGELVERAAKNGCQIICLPELYATPYFPQRADADKDQYAETIPGESTELFGKIARRYRVVIVVPLYEKAKTKSGRWRYYNSAVVIDDRGRVLPPYRKTHIPHDPGFYEKNYFADGDSGYRVYQTKNGTFAVLICYDQWFPEAARAARLLGAEMLFYPTAIGNVIGYIPPEGDWHEAWETSMRGHAIANSVTVVAVNRVGTEERMRFWGQSFATDAFGKVLKRASKTKEEVLTVKVDLALNEFTAQGWGFLRNRRPSTYGILASSKLVEKSKKLKDLEQYRATRAALEKRPS